MLIEQQVIEEYATSNDYGLLFWLLQQGHSVICLIATQASWLLGKACSMEHGFQVAVEQSIPILAKDKFSFIQKCHSINLRFITPKVTAGKPFWITLNLTQFEAFQSRETREYRAAYGPHWNEQTCTVGRSTTLALGFRSPQKLHGIISSFRVEQVPSDLPGQRKTPVAVIGILLL